MLPYNLLPSGVLAQMRSTAQQFFTTPVVLYSGGISYNQYGEQALINSVVWSGLAYFGALTGADREVLGALAREGVNTTYTALVLIPFGTSVDSSYIIRSQNEDWRIIWDTDYTQDSVQVYTKCVVAKIFKEDEDDI